MLGRAQSQPLREKACAHVCTQEEDGCFLVINLKEPELVGSRGNLLKVFVKTSPKASKTCFLEKTWQLKNSKEREEWEEAENSSWWAQGESAITGFCGCIF